MGFDPAVLDDNLRCKIIYYSCLQPNTIANLTKAWGYGSPTYLYQGDSLDRLKEAGLIAVEKQDGKNIIASQYAALFDEKNVERSRERVNQEILKEFLVHSKGFQPTPELVQDENDLLAVARGNLDAGMEERLAAMEFSQGDYETLTGLWRNPVFREAFLGLDIVTGLFGGRKGELPSNPLDYLFKLTAGVVAAMGRGRNETGMEIPPGLAYRAERVIVPAHRVLDRMEPETEEYVQFVSGMRDLYSLFRTKFQDDRFHYGFVQDFIDLTMQNAGEKRFGKLFDKYRRDSLF